MTLGTLAFRGESSYAAIRGGDFNWQVLSQNSGTEDRWFGGLPVESGATWSNLGRTAGEFPGSTKTFKPASFGDINFGSTDSGGFDDDPQRVGDDSWYLLFKTTSSSSSPDLYGWLSFDASLSTTAANRSITVTGWGFESDGSKIAAGATSAGGAVPEPSSMATLAGLAALAAGAAGVRRVRKKKKIADSDASNQLAS